MMTIDQIPTPALLIDSDLLKQNLDRMQAMANHHGVALRPHIKTHKCLEIAQKQRQLGAKGITVSTLFEAKTFAAQGFDDITWAIPLPLSRIEQALDLARTITLRLVVDSETAFIALVKAWQARLEKKKIRVWIKIDCGYHRAGLDPHSPVVINLVKAVQSSPATILDGLLTHAGHSYHATSPEAVRAIGRQEISVMKELAQRLRREGQCEDQSELTMPLSLGSTPTLSLNQEGLEGVTEIRPGNYAFYDYTQAILGSCRISDCALTVLTSVISAQPQGDYGLVDAGALALSKDAGPEHLMSEGRAQSMGQIFRDYQTHSLYSSNEMQLVSLSQEMGKIVKGKEIELKVGQKLRLLENHSCLTAAQFDQYYVCQGEKSHRHLAHIAWSRLNNFIR